MTNFEMTNFEKKNFDVNPERPASRVCLNSFIFRIISGFQCNYFDKKKLFLAYPAINPQKIWVKAP